LPIKVAFALVYRVIAEAGLTDRVVFLGSGKLGLPGAALLAFALGCDGVNVGREAMLSIGCIQAQRCHTDRCPTGVATQSRRLQRGLDPTDKSVRCANYLSALRHELQRLSRACGVAHPALVTTEQVEILDDRFGSESARSVFGYDAGWGRPGPTDVAALGRLLDDGPGSN
ncbi:MAG: glutamate synthase-related protein, partial [Actinomycetota bacterium]